MKGSLFLLFLFTFPGSFLLGSESTENKSLINKNNAANSWNQNYLYRKNQTPEKRLLYKGIEEYREKNYKKAIEIWEEVLKINPDNNKAKKYIARAEYKLDPLKKSKLYPPVKYCMTKHVGIQFYPEHIKSSKFLDGGSYCCIELFYRLSRSLSIRLKYSTELFNDLFNDNLVGGSIQLNSYFFDAIGIKFNHYFKNKDVYNPYIGIGYLKNLRKINETDYIIFKICLLKVESIKRLNNDTVIDGKFSLSLFPISIYTNLKKKDITWSFEVLNISFLF